MDTKSRWECKGGGVYIDTRTGKFYHRPKINGKPTFRVLDVHTLTLARELKAQLTSQQTKHANGCGKDPYCAAPSTVGQLIEGYRVAGCPMKHQRPRHGNQLAQELSRIKFLETFWSPRRADQVKPRDCTAYFAARKTGVRAGCTGGRAVDMELATLAGVFNWAVFAGSLETNPLAQRPKFRDGKQIKHCRDYMPTGGAELHKLAQALFRDPRSEPLGWQLLLEAMTGCRTNEILRLRWDAKSIREAGFIDGSHLWLNRSKGGINPWVEIHPALAQTLDALRQWRIWRGLAASPWFIPGRDREQAMDKSSLTHALGRVSREVAGAHRTSHGLRAFYVTVRRSMGIADGQIAAEIGDASGAPIIISTYGSVPPNWQGGAGMTWGADPPAWFVFDMPQNIVDIAEASNRP
jgi:integrase